MESSLPVHTNSLSSSILKTSSVPKVMFATYYRSTFNNGNPPETRLYPIADRDFGIQNAMESSYRITNSFWPFTSYNDNGLSVRLIRDFS